MRNKKESQRIGVIFWIGGLASVSHPLYSVMTGLKEVEESMPWITGLFTQFVIGGLISHFVYVGLKKLFLALKGRSGDQR